MRRWIAFTLFFAFIGIIIFIADTGHARWVFNGINAVPFGDKAGHFVLFGTLAFLLNRALGPRTVSPGLRLGGVLVAVFVIIEECSQLWIPSRTFDFGDLFADAIGIALADVLARRWE